MLFWIFFGLVAGGALLELGLTLLNGRWSARHGDRVPEVLADRVDGEKAARIAAYTRAKTSISLLGDGAGKALMLGLLLVDGFAALSLVLVDLGWGPVSTGLLFFGVLALAGSLLSLPFEAWFTFRVETRFGFNRTSLGLFVIDRIKGLVLGVILGGALLAALLALLYHAGSWWWVICWATVLLFSLGVSWLYPLVIAPLFNRFTPLEPGPFRERVEALLTRAGIRTKGVFVMDAGKRSTHTNAYFTGLGRTKRIVFYDTLLEKHDEDEALAVLAHEAGHWKGRHVLKNLVAGQAMAFGLFAISGRLIAWEGLYKAFGFDEVTPYAGLFLLSLVYGPALMLIAPNALSTIGIRYTGRAPSDRPRIP